jgi:hypothetical protein
MERKRSGDNSGGSKRRRRLTMTTSKAQIKASNKYNKDKTLTVCLRLNKETDKDIIEILERVNSKQGYIKELIRLDYIRDHSID